MNPKRLALGGSITMGWIAVMRLDISGYDR